MPGACIRSFMIFSNIRDIIYLCVLSNLIDFLSFVLVFMHFSVCFVCHFTKQTICTFSVLL